MEGKLQMLLSPRKHGLTSLFKEVRVFCFRTPGTPIRTILVHTGKLPCLVPWSPQIMQICVSLRSRSGCWPFLGLFLEPKKSNVKLNWRELIWSKFTEIVVVFYLILQACISFFGPRISVFCLFRVKFPLLKFCFQVITASRGEETQGISYCQWHSQFPARVTTHKTTSISRSKRCWQALLFAA